MAWAPGDLGEACRTLCWLKRSGSHEAEFGCGDVFVPDVLRRGTMRYLPEKSCAPVFDQCCSRERNHSWLCVFRDALPLLSEDFEAYWPNARERVCGTENFVALDESYQGVHRRIDKCADAVVTDISDGDISFSTVSFLEARCRRIVGAEERLA